MIPNNTVDTLIALRILHMLVTPFKETQAYKFGIIDDKGNPLKKSTQLRTDLEISSYSILHRLVFRLKRIIEKLPLENKTFLSYAAALALIKENYNSLNEASVSDLEVKYLTNSFEVSTRDMEIVEHFFSNKYIMPYKLFEEMGAAAVPANNIAATGGITLPDPPSLLANKKVIKRTDKGKYHGSWTRNRNCSS